MSTFTNNNVASGDLVRASDHNTQGANIAAVVNGNIDTDNLADGAVTAAKQGDSGWVAATIVSNVTSDLEVRKIGSVVYARGNTDRDAGNLIAGQYATIPAGYRPSELLAILCPGSGGTTFKVTISTNGEVRVAGLNGSSTYFEIAHSWTVA